MESEVVRRRVHMIAAHFASKDDISPAHLLPMNCSGSLNSVLRRCDNKIYFARQASASLGPFMRQTSLEEGSFTSPGQSASKDDISPNHLQPMNCGVPRRFDNKIYFARQASESLGPFMRQTSLEKGSLTAPVAPKSCVAFETPCNVREPCFARSARTESNFQSSLTSAVATKSCGVASETPCNVREPCFARPTRTESNFSNVSMGQPLVQSYDVLAPNPPSFARPGRLTAKEEWLPSEKKMCRSEVSGVEWSPRMDVAESEGKYVMTVEVPGVSIKDIRVEVDDQKLSVKGKRSTSFWRVMGNPNGSFSSYHRREILYGPYEAVWPLPAGVNKDRVSAEFLDGFLQIIIPKV
ncbi:uncharacterized protein LOC114747377 isoform X1 [Neltuma alba]|uniref:uncharacterized protein LOC114747377 isoform X1 n=1 Tax=Neltuma alba TaxID=207710 RepID=UPI0010A402C1|nr:uncharacterized protein LOC114747377 isoform X1 [Prosopis alba]